MLNGEEEVTAKGVILHREDRGENRLWSTVFLQGIGMVGVSSKNFAGDSEPFVGGEFYFKRLRNGRYFMFDTDIKDTMLHIRRRGLETLQIAFAFVNAVMKYLPYEQPDDDLLVNLYWSMKLLTIGAVPPSAAHWRFVWRWLNEWGLAPELRGFCVSGNFLQEEFDLLSQVAGLTPKAAADIFSGKLNPNIRQNVFRVAVNNAVKFLDQI